MEIQGILCGVVSDSPAYEPITTNDFNIQQVIRDILREFLGYDPGDWGIEPFRALSNTLLGGEVLECTRGGGWITVDEAQLVFRQ